MTLSAIPRELRDAVFRRDAGRCQYCQLAQVGQAAVFHIDHIVPKSRGGETAESNLALQCPNCSLHKSNKTEAVDPLTAASTPLFHPLRHRWLDHFAIDADGTCVGLTPKGRATVAALHMNDELPRVARSLQIRYGLITPRL